MAVAASISLSLILLFRYRSVIVCFKHAFVNTILFVRLGRNFYKFVFNDCYCFIFWPA